jgi:hypothetical protein
MAMMVRMHVDVPIAVMFVLVRMEFIFEGLMERPETDAEQHYTHHPFAPG